MGMTNEEKLERLSKVVSDADDLPVPEDILQAYLDMARDEILLRAFPYNPEILDVPSQYDTLQIEISAYMFNKRGAEGQTSHGENLINRSWESGGIPMSMLRQIIPKVGVI